jgi:hypothetical protein
MAPAVNNSPTVAFLVVYENIAKLVRQVNQKPHEDIQKMTNRLLDGEVLMSQCRVAHADSVMTQTVTAFLLAPRWMQRRYQSFTKGTVARPLKVV